MSSTSGAGDAGGRRDAFLPHQVLGSSLDHLQNFFKRSHAIQEILGHRTEWSVFPATVDPGCHRLTISRNSPNDTDGKQIIDSWKISADEITDRRIRKRFFYYQDCQQKEVNFTFRGYCEGMSFWFIYLYLHTKDQFFDPRRHMQVLGEQFAHGAGMEPVLLEHFYLGKGKLLGLKVGTQPEHSSGVRRNIFKCLFSRVEKLKTGMERHPEPLISVTPKKWKKERRELIQELQKLPVGVWVARLPGHKTVYVKIHQERSFFFDPNSGISEITGSSQGRQLHILLTEILKQLPRKKNKSAQSPATWSNMELTPVTLRTAGQFGHASRTGLSI